MSCGGRERDYGWKRVKESAMERERERETNGGRE